MGTGRSRGRPRVFAAWRAYQHEHHDPDQLQTEIAPIQTELRQLLEQASHKSRRTRWHRQFANNLLKIWPALWTFTTTEGIEPTNKPRRARAPRSGHPPKTLARHPKPQRRAIRRARALSRRNLPTPKPLAVHLPQRTDHRPQPRRAIPRPHLRPRGLNAYRKPTVSSEFSYAPGEIRTPDLRFRRPTLYPAELRALADRF